MSNATASLLPARFAMLEPLLAEWALSSANERNRKRIAHEHDPEHLRAFYDAMLPHMDAILEYLNALPLEAMPAPERRLFDLALSFAEVAHFVELRWRRWFGPLRVTQTVSLPHSDHMPF